MEFDAPRHWAPSIGSADVSADAGPLDGAPRAGGSKKQPPPAQDWEWDLVTTISASEAPPGPGEPGSTRIHRGGCHCGAIRFEVEAPRALVVWECNVSPAESNSLPLHVHASNACHARSCASQCTDCRMRRNLHFVVPKRALKLVKHGPHGRGGVENLAEYRWGTGVARHLFCARCGISPFYQPRSNPEGWGITFPCLDGGTVSSVEVRQFDGLNWEKCIEDSGASIKGFSIDKQADKKAETSDAAQGAAAPKPPAASPQWVWLLVEVLATFVLPLVLILLAVRHGGRKGVLWQLPGKPQP